MYLFVMNLIGLGARPTATLDIQRIGYSGNLSFTKAEDMPITKLTPEIITAAILGFEEQKRHIDSQISGLKAMLSGDPAETDRHAGSRSTQAQEILRCRTSQNEGGSTTAVCQNQERI